MKIIEDFAKIGEGINKQFLRAIAYILVMMLAFMIGASIRYLWR